MQYRRPENYRKPAHQQYYVDIAEEEYRRPDHHGHHAHQQYYVNRPQDLQVYWPELEAVQCNSLPSPPPFTNFDATAFSNHFQAARPEPRHNVRVVDNEPVRDRRSEIKVEAEDVDAEADEFIKLKHKKLLMSKTISASAHF